MCFLLRRYVRSGSELIHSTAAHSPLSFSSFSGPSCIKKERRIQICSMFTCRISKAGFPLRLIGCSGVSALLGGTPALTRLYT